MRIMRSASAAAALFILVLCLALGCGSNDTSQSTQAPLSKASFIKKGDSICGRIDTDEFKGAARYIKEHPHQSEEVAQENLVLHVALPLVQEAIEEFRKLPPPDAKKAEVEAMISAMEEGVEDAKKDPAATLGSEGNPFDSANHLAGAYGFEVCKDIL